MFNIQFNAGGSRAALQRAVRSLSDMTPIYADVGEYMIQATRKRFQQQKAPDGTAWAKKSPATLDRYKRLGYGHLNRVLTGPSRRLSREIQKFVSKDGMLIGSSLIYSGVMQDGAAKGAFGADRRGRPIPWGRIPARVWLGLSAEDDAAIIDIVDEHLESGLSAE